MDGTLRQRIFALLTGEDWLSLRDLSQTLGVAERDLPDHLRHIERGLHRMGSFAVEPARCMRCGHTFRKRRRLTRPSRCPLCGAGQILGPRFRVISKGSNVRQRGGG